MSTYLLAILGVFFLLMLMLLRVHIGLAFYITGFLGYWVMAGDFSKAVASLSTQPYAVTATFVLAVLPLFLLMGVFSGYCGFARDAYSAARVWVGGVRGGLGVATVAANTLFAAACASSMAASAIFTKFSLPEMRKQGYQLQFACAIIVTAGTIAMLIPPSVLMIIYGMLTEESIGRLFIAGVFPGLLLAVLYSIAILVIVRLRPQLAAEKPIAVNWKDRLLSIPKIWGIIVLVVLVLGGIYGGIFTPTEAGATGAFAAFIIALILRKLNWRVLMDTLQETARTNAMMFIILSGATLFSRFLTLSGLPDLFCRAIESSDVPPLLVLGLILLTYLILGCIMDSIPMMTITLPLFFPIAQSIGWDPLWFAILVIIAVEMGLLTPPIGMTVFVVKAVAGPEVSLESLFKAVIPFFLVMLLGLVILIAFPQIVTFLPGLMFKLK